MHVEGLNFAEGEGNGIQTAGLLKGRVRSLAHPSRDIPHSFYKANAPKIMRYILRLASFRYVSRTREDRKCFSSVLAWARKDLRLSPATRARFLLCRYLFYRSLAFLEKHAQPGEKVLVRSRTISRSARRKCPGRFKRTLKPFHPRNRKSAISMLTRALSITLLGMRLLSNHSRRPYL